MVAFAVAAPLGMAAEPRTEGALDNHNDAFASAIELCCWPTNSPAPVFSSTHQATLEPGEPRPCGGIGKTVWYKLSFGSPDPWPVLVDTFGSDFDTVLAAYRIRDDGRPQTLANLVSVACNDDTVNLKSLLVLLADPDYNYYFQLGGFQGAGGNSVLNYEGDHCTCLP